MNEMEKILQNEELLEAITAVETPAELGELFAQNGIQLEEGYTIEKAFADLKAQENAELGEEALDDVAGGIALLTGALAAGAFTVGAGAVIFIGGYAYQKVKNAVSKKKKKK